MSDLRLSDRAASLLRQGGREIGLPAHSEHTLSEADHTRAKGQLPLGEAGEVDLHLSTRLWGRGGHVLVSMIERLTRSDGRATRWI
ncbi:hypothetical protein FF100_26140 [Methylobacterium terricola]|uniref:Uncharacterized protein n=1 Tax=Methylobacterium terricola TaxID=2583531 RepID=A0A5C4LC80_9HYPH|nr:hypothetical protein FF100_26140 [Methylobacterium terricola]